MARRRGAPAAEGWLVLDACLAARWAERFGDAGCWGGATFAERAAVALAKLSPEGRAFVAAYQADQLPPGSLIESVREQFGPVVEPPDEPPPPLRPVA